jgi:hypothetical protein
MGEEEQEQLLQILLASPGGGPRSASPLTATGLWLVAIQEWCLKLQVLILLVWQAGPHAKNGASSLKECD